MQLIKDWHLMLVILLFIVVDVIMLGTVTAIDGSRYTAKVIPHKENLESFVNVSYLLFICKLMLDGCYIDSGKESNSILM